MNSRTPASALRATMRIHGSMSPIISSLAFAGSTGCASVRRLRTLPRAQRRQLPLAGPPGSSVPRRHASQSAAVKAEKDSEQYQQEIQLPDISPKEANPPASTRPPPIVLPIRQPETSTFQHYFAIGKAYLTFYKTGVKNIYHNTRLLYPSSKTDDATKSQLPQPGTRSYLQLRDRWGHDIRRLPIFALLLIVCGEFTPLVVVAIPSIVPYTCRLPQHVDKLRKKMEGRRANSLANYHHTYLSTPGPEPSMPVAHLCRMLGLVSPLWDKTGFVPPFITYPRLAKRLNFLLNDSGALLNAGGVEALEDEEVKLACSDRGIDVLNRSDSELRDVLSKWLQLVMAPGRESDDSWDRMVFLLTRPERQWPAEF